MYASMNIALIPKKFYSKTGRDIDYSKYSSLTSFITDIPELFVRKEAHMNFACHRDKYKPKKT